jgi:MFS family permease
VEERIRARTEHWLNPNVFGMGLTSFLSDAGHEMATAILPGFLATIGASAAALGTIEGVADAVSSFVKLGAGWYSDRIGHRKGITVLGYFLTGAAMALFALAVAWPLVLVGRTLGWFGRGIRGPLRDAILSESVSPGDRGKAFGFHRAGDTLGAIVGPLIAVGLLALWQPAAAAHPSAPFRTIFLLTLIPGIGSALAFAALVREERRAANHGLRLWKTMASLPAGFRRLLVGVGVFGLGDYAPTLLILAATQLLTPARGVVGAAQMAALLYVLRNVFYAGAAYPVGALSDRFRRQGVLAAGYLVGVLVSLGFVAAFARGAGAPTPTASLPWLAVLFALAGIMIATEDALEGALTADLVEPETRGTAYGLMGTVNGVGDLVSSVIVGLLWALHPAAGFAYAAAMKLLGTLLLLRVR